MYFFSSLLLVTATASAVAVNLLPTGRCLPSQPCWPSDQTWQALNESVSGRLVTVKPVGWPCHDPTLDSALCDERKVLSTNSSWRREQPGALQYQNWEALPSANESCFMKTPSLVPCGQGRVPVYSVVAETVGDIQQAVRFARDQNLRLVVKNTGHDFLGRSGAPHSLQIATFKMRELSFSDEFVPKGAPGGRGLGSTVTVEAGAVLDEIYPAVKEEGKVAVLGAAHTVGAAGGYIQGGGHSPIGSWKGMASDNAVEFEVVTADGDLVTANQYQHQELFWALRGGGGGTFGVVTKVTLRTFDEVPTVAVNLTISMPWSPNSSYWQALAEFSSHIPTINDENCAGYLFLVPKLSLENFTVSVLQADTLCMDQSAAKVDKLFDSVLAPIRALPDVTVTYNSTSYPTTNMALDNTLIVGSSYDQTGDLAILGSRLISRDLLQSSNGGYDVAKTISQLQTSDGELIQVHFVAGGQVTKNVDVESGLNPIWRKAALSVIWTRSWPPGTSAPEIHAVEEQVTREVEMFKALEPDMGAYSNEANPNEVDFQKTFWGENYARLYDIKQKVDARGLFIARKGVGSEDWDDQGLCRRAV
ncbi:FAD-binding domain-containing protein [Aspergillus affinis]|uniref:FAD-binding domain-containing protein n=1 Tax=Aspergillus affinis TaxID=1070780 RepID=UPI0022FDF0A8|nr:FAD-binding domain-containing protein [Aspergillus affinis]KAI9039633.1 FAD-binding domain-containing protein [Aspergillus affinis]